MFAFAKRQRALAEIERRRGDEATYTTPLPHRDAAPAADDLKDFLSDFYRNILFKRQAEMKEELLQHPDTVQKHYNNLVPSVLHYEDFWQRYYFRCGNVDRVIAELDAARTQRAQSLRESFVSTVMSVQKKQASMHDNNNNNNITANDDEDDEEKKNRGEHHQGPTAAAAAKQETTTKTAASAPTNSSPTNKPSDSEKAKTETPATVVNAPKEENVTAASEDESKKSEAKKKKDDDDGGGDKPTAKNKRQAKAATVARVETVTEEESDFTPGVSTIETTTTEKEDGDDVVSVVTKPAVVPAAVANNYEEIKAELGVLLVDWMHEATTAAAQQEESEKQQALQEEATKKKAIVSTATTARVVEAKKTPPVDKATTAPDSLDSTKVPVATRTSMRDAANKASMDVGTRQAGDEKETRSNTTESKSSSVFGGLFGKSPKKNSPEQPNRQIGKENITKTTEQMVDDTEGITEQASASDELGTKTSSVLPLAKNVMPEVTKSSRSVFGSMFKSKKKESSSAPQQREQQQLIPGKTAADKKNIVETAATVTAKAAGLQKEITKVTATVTDTSTTKHRVGRWKRFGRRKRSEKGDATTKDKDAAKEASAVVPEVEKFEPQPRSPETSQPASARLKKEIFVSVLVLIVALIAAIILAAPPSIRLMIGDGLCAPVIPRRELLATQDDVVAAAPWWAPDPFKQRGFRTVCGDQRVRTILKWTNVGNKNKPSSHHRLELVDADSEKQRVLMSKKRLYSAKCFGDRIELILNPDGSKMETIPAPWKLP